MKRLVKKVFDAEFRVDGDFIHYDSSIGADMVQEFDPFLLFDVFGDNRQPDERVLAVPFRPHRGMETITYIMKGYSEHKDYQGNLKELHTGDVLLMHAGKGILHSERSIRNEDGLYAMQLWVNLPKEAKLSKPYYEVQHKSDAHIVHKEGQDTYVLFGEYEGKKGLSSNDNKLTLLDVKLTKGASFHKETTADDVTWLYVLDGALILDERAISSKQMVLFQAGSEVDFVANEDVHFLFVEGQPLQEDIAWGGTFVMNTKKELEDACIDLDKQVFDKFEDDTL